MQLYQNFILHVPINEANRGGKSLIGDVEYSFPIASNRKFQVATSDIGIYKLLALVAAVLRLPERGR
jgi:hypothetical protein